MAVSETKGTGTVHAKNDHWAETDSETASHGAVSASETGEEVELICDACMAPGQSPLLLVGGLSEWCAGASTAGACVFCAAGTYQTGSGLHWEDGVPEPLVWLFSLAWDAVIPTLDVGFICPFVVIDPTD